MPQGAKDIAQRFNDQLNQTFKMIMQVLFVILFSSISIACIAVGQSRKSLCPLETKIPTWLVVYGIVGVVWNTIYVAALIVKFCFCRDEENEKACDACVRCLQSLVSIFMLVWVILGSVWFFKVKASVQYDEPELDSYCDKGMFNFLFVLLILSYVFPGLICCLICCACACACCGLILTDDDD